MTKKQKQERKQMLNMMAGARGIERKEFFANGGTLTDWMGGPRLVVADKKKKKNKRACRGRVRY